ncbi:metal-dependent transcriptional regulator [Bacteriovorax sp. DB6_IX]|uniref:metal-dependent transcriptional regulator n=1 Tax=Bacteriovorax sp. DB6_IX TaxID=1353530 RepID=UPI00038A29F3|nr:metal-dependent transcriptional regulator [Bacteriovorax sp. DB6_IX]EQC50773.1 iron dependent repressor, metal binding/dimerization domain protein [Bacteriovorax sp. DB6_IX]
MLKLQKKGLLVKVEHMTTEKKAREAELSHSMVHYLLTIHKLREDRGYARVTDIARDLGLTKGSVSTALNNLKKKGLVKEEEDTKFLLLTEEGHDEVHRILSSRTLLYYFLKDFVGVDEDVAAHDSCMMEHLMSPETSVKFFEFMKNLACSCDDLNKQGKLPEGFNFKTTLDLCEFKSAEEFMEGQKGDKYLDEDHH